MSLLDFFKSKSYKIVERKIAQAKIDGAIELNLISIFGTPYNEIIINLPESLGQLTQLKKLYLNGNLLRSMPESLSQLTLLQILSLGSNQFSQLPKNLNQLTELQELNLDTNKLIYLSENLSELTQLKKLILSRNKLQKLPENLGQLSHLKKLWLNDNNLSSLPESLGQLSQLQEFIINDNQLTQLPEDLSQLKQLQYLDLCHNQLSQLPESLGQLTQLKKLKLWGNQLTDLPASFAQLENLQTIELGDNPLNPELATAYKQGTKAVKAYLRSKQQSIVLNEAKLILIGEGAVGKSSLLATLRGEDWIEDRETTHGVEVSIKSLELTDKETKKTITFNGWDFGGQAIYRNTHQMYFTAPAVYLAVWNPREGVKQGLVDEWIQMVKLRAFDENNFTERPRILVVATHAEKKRLAHIDEQALRTEFGDLICGFFHVDSKTGKGLDELKQAIVHQAVQIPSVGREVAKTWAEILSSLRQQTEAYISYQRFESLCEQQNIDSELAVVYANMLNELGHIVYYQQDTVLQNTLILKAEWLSKAMSFVLEDKTTKDGCGLATSQHLTTVWNQHTHYPQKIHLLFLHLMNHFDFSYPVQQLQPNAPETHLIAQLVPSNRPKNWQQAWSETKADNDSQRTHICRIVEGDTGKPAEVEGLLYRLIVRLHRYSLGKRDYTKSIHWKKGLILDDDYNGRAFIEDVSGDIHVTVRGAYPEHFLHLLCEEVRGLIEPWKGLDYRLSIPCHIPCKGSFSFKSLIALKKRGTGETYCDVCDNIYDIDSLLGKVKPKLKMEQALTEIKKNLGQMLQNQEKLQQGQGNINKNVKRLYSQSEEQYNALLTALTDPAKDAPRLFSFEPVNTGFFDKPNWIEQKFRLVLWCEHARQPVYVIAEDKQKKQGVYQLKLTRKWVKKSAPLIKTLSTTLSLVLPIVAPSAKLLMDSVEYKTIENQLKFGEKCAQLFLKAGDKAGDWLVSDDNTILESAQQKQLRQQDSNLRELHALLREQDPREHFGGLVKVQNKTGRYFWVHEQFRDEY